MVKEHNVTIKSSWCKLLFNKHSKYAVIIRGNFSFQIATKGWLKMILPVLLEIKFIQVIVALAV